MSITVIQSGATLQTLSTAGVPTTLTLPTGVTLRTDVPPRWCVYGRNVVLVNTPSQPLTIDASGTVRLLTPRPPRLAPILAGVAGGALTGSYRSQMTFVIQDVYGNVIAESDYSPYSAQVAIAAKYLGASNLDISPDQITGRRLYRTTDNGAVYFQWVDLDGNIITSIQDDLSDAGLSLFAAPKLGTPPRLTSVAEFRGRLFGVGDVDIDHARFTETGVQYAWPEDNLITIPSIGSDEFGIVALVPRREALGFGRRNSLVQVTGTGVEDSDGIADFDAVILSKELGIESQETTKVYRDTAYFLWKDGVYSWNSEGLTCVSDGDVNGRGSVRSWFTTDDYFNRDRFTFAFAHIDPHQPKYRLYLCSADSTTIDSFVDYDINNKTWWGPHATTLFTPTSAFNRSDSSDKDVPMVGSADSVYQEQATRTDGTATAITFDCIGKSHDLGEPDQEKFFGELSMLGGVQAAGTLTVTSRTGDYTQTRELVQYADLTRSRQRLGRLGQGKHARIELTNAEVAKNLEIFGYDIDPVNLIGRR